MRFLRALALIALAAPAAAAPEPQTTWYRIATSEGAVVGHSSQLVTETPDGRETVSTQELLLQEPGDPVSHVTDRTTMLQDRAGRIVAITDEATSGKAVTRTTARITTSQAEIVRTVRDTEQ